MTSKIQKERAQEVIPGGTKKKETSSKPLIDIKKPKRKSAKKNYPRRNEKKKDSSSKSLNDVSKSKLDVFSTAAAAANTL